jgi:heme-degrading monooxygenase HmoA
MHARVTRSRVSPERIDESIAWFERSALPRARSTPGFAGAIELYDRETGAGLTVTLWETKEARDESERLAATIRSEGETEEGFEILGVERYEVTTHGL